MALDLNQLMLAIIVATLAAIVISLRVLLLLERRIARIDIHVEKLALAVLKEDIKIEKLKK